MTWDATKKRWIPGPDTIHIESRFGPRMEKRDSVMNFIKRIKMRER